MRAGHGALVVTALGLLLLGCGGDDTGGSAGSTADDPAREADAVIDPGDDGSPTVEIDPEAFTSRVDHPYLPKLPGTRWVYEATSDDGEIEVIVVDVLDETRTVMGVETIVVRDVVRTTDGELVEDTFDWFAQDDDGNVWYFGEDTKAYDEDGNVSEAGAWEAGVDGALPGIVMPADPVVSDIGYRQEYLAGEAEDMGQIIQLAPGVVVTRDWTPLEPDVVEEKTYVEGVGFVHEGKATDGVPDETVVLVEFVAAPDMRAP